MSRSNKSKIAVTLLGALAFGANAQAQDLSKNKITKTDSFSIKNAKSPQATGEIISKKNSGKNKIVRTDSFSILGNVVTGTLIAFSAAEAANETVAGITLAKGKEPEKLIEGKYSIINGVRLMLKGKENSQNPNSGEENNTGLEGFLKKFEKAELRVPSNDKLLMSHYNKNKEYLISAYDKVSKSKDCNGFYDSGMKDSDIANAILNFIAGEQKFATNLAVSKVSFNGSFGVTVNNVFYFFVPGGDGIDFKIVGNGRVILKI